MPRLLIVIGLALVMAGPTLAAYPDVHPDHWAYDAVAKVSQIGLMTARTDGLFHGDNSPTRFELALALARTLAEVENRMLAKTANPEELVPYIERINLVVADEIDKMKQAHREVKGDLKALEDRLGASGAAGWAPPRVPPPIAPPPAGPPPAPQRPPEGVALAPIVPPAATGMLAAPAAALPPPVTEGSINLPPLPKYLPGEKEAIEALPSTPDMVPQTPVRLRPSPNAIKRRRSKGLKDSMAPQKGKSGVGKGPHWIQGQLNGHEDEDEAPAARSASAVTAQAPAAAPAPPPVDVATARVAVPAPVAVSPAGVQATTAAGAIVGPVTAPTPTLEAAPVPAEMMNRPVAAAAVGHLAGMVGSVTVGPAAAPPVDRAPGMPTVPAVQGTDQAALAPATAPVDPGTGLAVPAVTDPAVASPPSQDFGLTRLEPTHLSPAARSLIERLRARHNGGVGRL